MNQAEQENEQNWKRTSRIAEAVSLNQAEQKIELNNLLIEKNAWEECEIKNPRKESMRTDQEHGIRNQIETKPHNQTQNLLNYYVWEVWIVANNEVNVDVVAQVKD